MAMDGPLRLTRNLFFDPDGMVWYEGDKRKAKALPSKALAEHFCHIKYAQLNSDVFTGIVDIGWRQMVDEYHHTKQVEGLQYASVYEPAFSQS